MPVCEICDIKPILDNLAGRTILSISTYIFRIVLIVCQIFLFYFKSLIILKAQFYLFIYFSQHFPTEFKDNVTAGNIHSA